MKATLMRIIRPNKEACIYSGSEDFDVTLNKSMSHYFNFWIYIQGESIRVTLDGLYERRIQEANIFLTDVYNSTH